MDLLYLTLTVLLSIFVLLVLVIRFKINAFIALMLVSIITGLVAGMDGQSLLKSIQDGMGGILGFVAIIVGLGAIFGEMLEFSGGAKALALDLVSKFGNKKASLALTFTGFLVAIPVFFDVGFIILVPIVYSLSRETKKSMVFYAVPLLTGLAITHAFIPPTPGPVAVTEILNADLGWVIGLGCIVGIPTAFLIGPLFGKLIAQKVDVHPSESNITTVNGSNLPRFYSILAIIAFPILLIVVKSIITMGIDSGRISNSSFIDFLLFIGHPFIALLLVTLVSLYYLGYKRGADSKKLLQLSTKALGPAGIIILITGAGGVYKQVLIDSGIGSALANALAETHLPILILAFLIASVVRVTQGSATVAMITAAGLMSPVTEVLQLPAPKLALVVLAIASGATILSHVNDSGFWIVTKYLGLTEKQGIQTWTTTSTAIAITGMIIILIRNNFL